MSRDYSPPMFSSWRVALDFTLRYERVSWWMFVITLAVNFRDSAVVPNLLWFNVISTLPLTWLISVWALAGEEGTPTSPNWVKALIAIEFGAFAANVIQLALRGRDFARCDAGEPCSVYPEHDLAVTLIIFVTLLTAAHALGAVFSLLLLRDTSGFAHRAAKAQAAAAAAVSSNLTSVSVAPAVPYQPDQQRRRNPQIIPTEQLFKSLQ